MSPVRNYLRQRLRRAPPLEVWYDESYRMPLPSLESATGIEPRRVEFASWLLLETGAIRPSQVRAPRLVTFEDIHRVHDANYVESLQQPQTLARIFGVDPSEIAVEPLLRSIRLATGATIAATRSVLARRGPALNLSGGFHHAAPAHGGGFCALNDIAIAIAVMRAEGFEGQVNVIDLDAHPPDGTALCLRDLPKAWIGSLSGSYWEPLPGVDETVLPENTGDIAYLGAVVSLLARMPAPDLVFVIAGGDVLAGDRYGKLGLSIAGARNRDWVVSQALHGVPSVWMPGGGYHRHTWKVLAGTGLVLAGKAGKRIPRRYDPLGARFSHISGTLSPQALHGELEITLEDVERDLGARPYSSPRLLGYYTASGLEYGLYRQGILGHIRRLGYDELRVELDPHATGDRFRLFGKSGGVEHLLIEAVLERRREGDEEFLFVNWLTLRNPRAQFSPQRPQMPGQEVPGLGLGREATELLLLMARRVGLAGVAFRPAWYHLAYAARSRFRFVDPARHGRFEALQRDTAPLPLTEVSSAIAQGLVMLNGQPYAWEASDMAAFLDPTPPAAEWKKAMQAERDRSVFAVYAPTSG